MTQVFSKKYIKKWSKPIVSKMGVKNTWIAGEKGYDAGKKVSGIKRHTETLDKVENILCDGGYTGPSFAQSIKEAIDCSVEIIKRTELHKFVVLPKRWIVKRTLAW
ncbi:hypothetical protein ACT4UT_21265, partial [Bacillus sp. B-TM1]